jgi:type IV pilus assembly protein PilY1
LTEQSYPHVYYNDLTPKMFDAKIFPFDSADPLDDPDRPYGWGTIMVMGMRYGGGHIVADTDRNDTVDATDKEMKSSYVIMDITNPEEPPVVLAEINLPGLGYTTCYPAVIPMRSKSNSGSSTVFTTNDWYLVFGSGPADQNGVPASRDTSGNVTNGGTIGEVRILEDAVSLQNGKLFVVSLNALTGADGLGKRVAILDENGALININSASVTAHIQEFTARSYVTRPITIDYDLDFNADVVYFGTTEWDQTNASWGGKLRRLITWDSIDPADWVDTLGTIDRADNVLLDLTYGVDGLGNLTNISQPISASPTVAVGKRVFFDVDASGAVNDFDRERWVFLGTGRFEVSGDASDSSQQSYYGIKEPYDPASPFGFTWEEVDRATLLDSTHIHVYDDKSVVNHPGTDIDTWSEMTRAMEGPLSYNGWYVDFLETNERNLGEAALLGGLLTFTTYEPSLDPCYAEGTSNLYARWYQTGTSFYRRIFRDGNVWTDTDGDGVQDEGETRISGNIDLGSGMALTPNIHTGRKEGQTAYIQTSTGDIITIEQEEAESTKSDKTSWTQQR